MKSQTTLDPFLSLMLTLAEQQKQTANVADQTQLDLVPLLPLVRLMTMNLARPSAAESSSHCRVFRFCSPSFSTTPSSYPSYSPPTAQECSGNARSALKRRAK